MPVVAFNNPQQQALQIVALDAGVAAQGLLLGEILRCLSVGYLKKLQQMLLA